MVIGSKNLQIKVNDTEGVTLEAGTYTAGQVVVEGATAGKFSFVALSDTARAFVLLDDVDTVVDGTSGVGATGVFNSNVANIQDGTITVELNAILQKKGIFLKQSIKEA